MGEGSKHFQKKTGTTCYKPIHDYNFPTKPSACFELEQNSELCTVALKFYPPRGKPFLTDCDIFSYTMCMCVYMCVFP